MKRLIIPLFLLVVAAIVGYRIYEEFSSPVLSADQRFNSQPAMLVNTVKVQHRTFESTLDLIGELRPLASVDVMSRISGRLKELKAERGDQVKKGQLLAIIDDEDLQQQIRRAEASIAVARAAVQREDASRKNLEIQLERYRKLHEESLISTQDLEDLESQHRVAVAQLNLATAQVDQAEASVRELKIQQEQTRIYSPLDGFVGTRYLDPGALVSPSVGILMVIDISRVKTVVPVIESAFRLINVGQSARVTVEAYPGKSFSGKVTRISPFLNPETRSADIEIEIDNPSQQLKPGMFAKVSIEAGTPSSSLSVPRSALLTRGNGKGVYLLDEEFRTVFHEIQIGRIQGDFVEVLGGLEEGTEVVTSGAQKLNEGDKVKVA